MSIANGNDFGQLVVFHGVNVVYELRTLVMNVLSIGSMAFLLALVSGIAWSAMDVARKLLSQQFGALSLSFWLVLAVTPIYGFWALQGGEVPANGYWVPAFCSMILAAIASVAFISAVRKGHLGKLIPVLALTPIISGIFGLLLTNEYISLNQWWAILAIVVSIFFLNDGLKTRRGSGLGLMLLVSFCWGVGTVLDKWAIEYATPPIHGFVQSGGVAFLLALAAMMTKQSLRIKSQSLGLFLLTVVIFVLAVSTQWFALQTMESGVLESIKRGVGIIGAFVWSMVLFKQSMRIVQICWCFVIIVASLVLAHAA